MSAAVTVAVPIWLSPFFRVTVLPVTTAVPSVFVTSSATRSVGVVSFVMLSVADAPVSEPAPKANSVGAAGAVLSRTTLCAVEMAVKSVAAAMLVTAALASVTA